ncbi:hypothetical protein D3C85_936940 [compost metagenome]
MLLRNSVVLRPLGPEFADIVALVEGMVEGAQPLGGLGRQVGQIVVEKVVQLGQVGEIFLGVDVPQEGPRRPLGTYEGVLAAHQVEIAAPQQPIVTGLIRHRQQLDGELARMQQIPGLGGGEDVLQPGATQHIPQ